MEKKKAAEEEKEKKNEEFLQLKEQYDAAVKLKEENIAAEIEREMRQIEYHMAVENVRAKLIEREAYVSFSFSLGFSHFHFQYIALMFKYSFFYVFIKRDADCIIRNI